MVRGQATPVLVSLEGAFYGILDLLLAGLVIHAQHMLMIVRRPDLPRVASPHLRAASQPGPTVSRAQDPLHCPQEAGDGTSLPLMIRGTSTLFLRISATFWRVALRRVSCMWCSARARLLVSS